MIEYDPKKLLKQIAPKTKIKRLLGKKLSLKRSALSFLDDVPFIDKKDVTLTALKTIKEYKKRVRAEKTTQSAIKKSPKQLIQRIENAVVYELGQQVKKKYAGKKGRWLPSDALDPRPLHQKFYGKIFIIGEGLPAGENGEMVEPGDEYGCQCGIEIITDETELKL